MIFFTFYCWLGFFFFFFFAYVLSVSLGLTHIFYSLKNVTSTVYHHFYVFLVHTHTTCYSFWFYFCFYFVFFPFFFKYIYLGKCLEIIMLQLWGFLPPGPDGLVDPKIQWNIEPPPSPPPSDAVLIVGPELQWQHQPQNIWKQGDVWRKNQNVKISHFYTEIVKFGLIWTHMKWYWRKGFCFFVLCCFFFGRGGVKNL